MGTIKSRLFRARQMLRQDMKVHEAHAYDNSPTPPPTLAADPRRLTIRAIAAGANGLHRLLLAASTMTAIVSALLLTELDPPSHVDRTCRDGRNRTELDGLCRLGPEPQANPAGQTTNRAAVLAVAFCSVFVVGALLIGYATARSSALGGGRARCADALGGSIDADSPGERSNNCRSAARRSKGNSGGADDGCRRFEVETGSDINRLTVGSTFSLAGIRVSNSTIQRHAGSWAFWSSSLVPILPCVHAEKGEGMRRYLIFILILAAAGGCDNDTPTGPSGPSMSFFVTSETAPRAIWEALPEPMRSVNGWPPRQGNPLVPGGPT